MAPASGSIVDAKSLRCDPVKDSRIVIRLRTESIAIFFRSDPHVVKRRQRILLILEQPVEFHLLRKGGLEAEGNAPYRHRVLNGAFTCQAVDSGIPGAQQWL